MSPHEGGLHPRFISARKRAHNARRGSIIFRYPHLVRGWPRQGRPAPLFQASTPRPRGHLSRDVGTGPKMRGSIMQRLHYEADTSQRGNRLGSSGASGRGTGKAPSIGEPAPDHASASVSDCSHRPIFCGQPSSRLSRVGGNDEAGLLRRPYSASRLHREYLETCCSMAWAITSPMRLRMRRSRKLGSSS